MSVWKPFSTRLRYVFFAFPCNSAYVTSYCFEINPLLMLLALLNKITKFSYFLTFC